jgi:acetylornithine/N-succinyldiaminopimelate aminotransferase
MTSTRELFELGNAHNTPSYGPSDAIMERGQGVTLFDRDGNAYLDFLAGIAVNCLGHAHPDLVKALQEQAAKLLHVSNMFYTEVQIRLMERLTSLSFADRVFLCNSGAESVEAAFKLARRYQSTVMGNPQKTNIISMNSSFHGRTLAAITATGQPKYHKGFEPLVPGFFYGDFNDLESIRKLVDQDTAAIIVEPIQGEGGVRPATPEFLTGLRDLCDSVGALLIFDEVQTGIGRTGTLFAYEGYGVEPDIITLAKGLGGGVPIGAMMATNRVFAGFEKGSHASTFGGNPLACAAALKVLDVIERDGLLENASQRGEQLMAALRELAADHPTILDVRGRGLMVGVECKDTHAGEIVNACRDQGLLVNVAGGATVRFVPPLIVTAQDVESAVSRFRQALEVWTTKQAA